MAPPHNNTTEACCEFAKCANIILQFKTDQSVEWVNFGVHVDRDQSSGNTGMTASLILCSFLPPDNFLSIIFFTSINEFVITVQIKMLAVINSSPFTFTSTEPDLLYYAITCHARFKSYWYCSSVLHILLCHYCQWMASSS